MNGNQSSEPVLFEDPMANYEPRVYSSDLERALGEEEVASIPSQPFVVIGPDATVRDALQVLADHKVSSLLVVEDGQLQGILTERDVLERVAERYPKVSERPVREVMTTNPTVVYETDPAAAAAAAIAVAGHRHVPVLRLDGSVAGIVGPRRMMTFIRSRDLG
ncbi:CBS domain-containing protein [Roseiconus nitratireducens]|uniref:CBS domain-containing protein n=1 Tax=Roseiconus nitratireducens TaxID=2605748 RepID=A0A5M6D875_9BACT|nr:CBS domain-containing protein [Roseiconus nitratireducens]KAA5543731.1 CBS domain-containing protein [Roseiconus nitratireducens]